MHIRDLGYFFNADKLKLYQYMYVQFLNQPCAACFLEIFLFVHQYAYVSVCLSVCSPPSALITSGMICYDIGHV